MVMRMSESAPLAESLTGFVLVVLTVWFIYAGQTAMVRLCIGLLVALAIARMVVRGVGR
jgi:hypothetical protein